MGGLVPEELGVPVAPREGGRKAHTSCEHFSHALRPWFLGTTWLEISSL